MKRIVVFALVLNAVLLWVITHQLVAIAGGGDLFADDFARNDGDPGDIRSDQCGDCDPVVIRPGQSLNLNLGARACSDLDNLQVEGFTRLERNVGGYWEYLHDQTGIELILLPGGSFNMGSPESEEGRNTDEGPVHEVFLTPYLVGKWEVTQAQWESVFPRNPQRGAIFFNHPDTHDWASNRGIPPARPVFLSAEAQTRRPADSISWTMVQDFEARTGLTLPTEAQWEYAARGGNDASRFFEDWVEGPSLGQVAWYETTGNRSSTRPIGRGSQAPNQYGLHDVYGNVSEWCEDVYIADFYSQLENCSRNPLATEAGNRLRVLRGGDYTDSLRPQVNPHGWTPDFNRLRSAAREAFAEDESGAHHPGAAGFRVVFNLPTE